MKDFILLFRQGANEPSQLTEEEAKAVNKDV
jgi:hypothetical protein